MFYKLLMLVLVHAPLMHGSLSRAFCSTSKLSRLALRAQRAKSFCKDSETEFNTRVVKAMWAAWRKEDKDGLELGLYEIRYAEYKNLSEKLTGYSDAERQEIYRDVNHPGHMDYQRFLYLEGALGACARMC